MSVGRIAVPCHCLLPSPPSLPFQTACIGIKLLSESVGDSAEVRLEEETAKHPRPSQKEKKKWKGKNARLASGLERKNSFPQPRSAPQAERIRSPLKVPSSSPFQYSLFSKSNTCDIKIKLLSLDLRSSFPDKINRARQHLNTDKEKLPVSALQIHMKVRLDTWSPRTHNFGHKIHVNVLNRRTDY